MNTDSNADTEKAKTITAIVIDDEAHARQALIHQLNAHPHIEIIAQCENGLAAVKAINDLQPQLIFLDVHMPKLDGFEVLELLGDSAPITVFATAHDEYAIQAFENNALDYLLKPINSARLEKTIERIAQRLNLRDTDTSATKALIQDIRQQQAPLQRVLIRDKGDVHVVAANDIIAIEAADDYVVIHTSAATHIKQDRINNFEQLLDPSQFCRIHRSTIINLDYLKGIETEGKDNRYANMKLTDDQAKQFSISRSGYSKLLAVL